MDGRELTGIDRALAEALDVEPPADFAARVRQRIAHEAPHGPRRRGWRIAHPLAAAACLTIAAGLMTLMTHVSDGPPPLPARQVPVGILQPADRRPVAIVESRQPPWRPARTAFVRSQAPREPEVLVPRADIEMYRRLISAAQRVPAAIVEPPRDSAAGPPISEIPIDPIRIDPIMPPTGGEGERR